MKFYFELLDTKGNVLNEGDIVQVSTHRNGPIFYCEVRYVAEKEMIVPFHNFAFKSLEKVSDVPKEAKRLNETLFKAWFLPNGESDESVGDYAIEWSLLSHSINRVVRVLKIEGEKTYQGKLF